MKLAVADEDLSACVSCGLCLPHCPTYRVTGEESASPRGRIAAMRATHATDAPAGPEFEEFMDLCVQCRGCEVACPSSVPFGRLMEGARATLARETAYQPRWRRLGYAVLGHHRLLLVASCRRLAPAGAGPARPPGLTPAADSPARLAMRRQPAHRQRPGGPSRTDAWLFTGCVMDAWMRPTHAAALRVMGATGARVALPGSGGDCCGALHVHAGLRRQAEALAAGSWRPCPGDAHVVVDSAGCGAALKDYGALLGTADARTILRPGARRARVAGRPDATGCRPPGGGSPARSRSRTRVTSATSSGPITTCEPCSPPTPTWSSWTTTGCVAAPAGPTPAPTPPWPGDPGPQGCRHRRDRGTRRRQRQPRLHRAPCRRGLDVRHPVDIIAWSLGWRLTSTTSAAASTPSPRSWPTWPWRRCETPSKLATAPAGRGAPPHPGPPLGGARRLVARNGG